MLREIIQLWPGGPSIALGTYFVYVKYLFSLLLAVFALVSFLLPRRPWVLLATLVLASVAFTSFDRPLGRPYGVVEEGRGLEALGHVMVTATGGAAGDGRLVGEANPHPLWGWLLAAMSGFDGERLWRLYRFVPFFSLLCLGCAVAFFSGALDEREQLPRGTLPGLATFFVLFLSSHRLSFLESESTFWSESFWSTPQLGIALAGLCLCLRWLADNSLSSSIAAALSFAFVGWLDPRLALLLAVGALPWMVVAKRWRQILVLASGLVLFLPFRAAPPRVVLPAAFGGWYDAVSRILSVTVDLGLVFVLAVAGIWLLLRSGRPRETLLGTCTLAALALWTLASCVPAMAQTLGPRTLNASVHMLLSVAAAYGLYQGLAQRGIALPGASKRVGLRASKLAPALNGTVHAVGLLSSFPSLVFSLLVDARSHGSDLGGERRTDIWEPSRDVGSDPRDDRAGRRFRSGRKLRSLDSGALWTARAPRRGGAAGSSRARSLSFIIIDPAGMVPLVALRRKFQ